MSGKSDSPDGRTWYEFLTEMRARHKQQGKTFREDPGNVISLNGCRRCSGRLTISVQLDKPLLELSCASCNFTWKAFKLERGYLVQ